MTKKALTKFITAILVIVFGICLAAPTPVFATDEICGQDLPESVKEAAGCYSDKTNKDTLPRNVINILNAIIGVAGLVAVVTIVIAGIQYMTSAGDAGKVKNAKNAILYACIGLVICALAFAIVNFVIEDIIYK